MNQLKTWLNIYNQKNNPIYLNLRKVSLSLNSVWLSGFTDAEGCFNVNITKRTTQTVGFRTKLRFILDQQYSKDSLVEIKNLFNAGNISLRNET